MNDNATQSFNPRINNPDQFFRIETKLLPAVGQKDKLLSIKELRGTSDVNLEHRIKPQRQLAKKNTEPRDSETRIEFLVRWVTGPLGERETSFDKLRSGMVVKSTDIFPRDPDADGSIHYPPKDIPMLVRNTDLGHSAKNTGKRGRASVCRKAELVWREGHGDLAEIHTLVVGQ